MLRRSHCSHVTLFGLSLLACYAVCIVRMLRCSDYRYSHVTPFALFECYVVRNICFQRGTLSLQKKNRSGTSSAKYAEQGPAFFMTPLLETDIPNNSRFHVSPSREPQMFLKRIVRDAGTYAAYFAALGTAASEPKARTFLVGTLRRTA